MSLRLRTASLEQRGDRFRLRIHIGGTSHPFTTPTKTRHATQLFAAAKPAEFEQAHESGVGRHRTPCHGDRTVMSTGFAWRRAAARSFWL
jgi:hypothetical protein